MESIAKEAISCSIPCILTHVGYPFYCKTNVQILEGKLADLESMRDGIERHVQTAQDKGDLIKPIVERWQNKVTTVQGEAPALIRASKDINRWFQGWWRLARYYLGQEAHEKIDIVKELICEGRSYSSASSVSDPASLPGLLPSVDFQTFPSREFTKNEIIEALKDEKINRVGVWGMGGVGKTTLIKEVGEQVMRNPQLFDRVVMATVSQNPDLIKIQNELAVKLGIENFASDNNSGRAEKLWARLKEKKILVILDDIWNNLNLAHLGISFRNDQKSCKVLLTSRSEDICNALNSQKNIKVEGLSNQDSWDLFRSNVGDVVVDDELAREVAKECKGLPLAIVTLGRALRGKDQLVWEDAAKQLKTSIYFQEGTLEVLPSIKLSYDYLQSEEIKHIFLFCCFFPEDKIFNVDDLIWLVLGEELLPNVDTLEDTRRRLHTIFNKLMASCLLLKGYDGEVMMHDIVRDAAISIAHEESNSFIVKAGLGLKRWPVMKNLRTCKRLSLIGNQISKFPDYQPECPQLLSLSLSSNFYFTPGSFTLISFTKIPDCFFERMTSLVALDLSRNKLSSLPPSLSCLVNLRTLCLQRNPLSDVSLVGELKKLEYLNLSETEIQSLPEGIGGLTNLRFLNFLEVPRLKIIPKTLLSNLSRLEELYMSVEINDILPELGSLNLLTTLHLNVVEDNVKCLSQEISIFGKDLKKFIITVGHSRFSYLDYQRSMALNAIISDPLANWVKVLLRKTEILFLDHCQGLKSIVEVGEGGFDNLKVLEIRGCDEIEYLTCVVEDSPQITFNGLEILEISNCRQMKKIIKSEEDEEDEIMVEEDHQEIMIEETVVEREQDETVQFPRLKTFKLYELPRLTTIWKRVIPLGSFQELNSLSVVSCGRLRYVFTRTMVQRLQRLENLEIERCSQMKKIIKSEEDEEDEIMVEEEDEEDEEDEIMVEEDHQEIMIEETVVEREQDETVQFPRLKTLVLFGLPSLTTIWKRVIPLGSFQELNSLTVSFCERLRYLFTRTMVQRLQRLENLEIYCSCQMKKIIKSEEDEEDEIMVEEDHQEIMIEETVVEREQDETVQFPRLKTFKLYRLSSLTTIWKRVIPLGSFQELNILTVERCERLRYLFTRTMVQRLQRLEILKIRNCRQMKKIIKSEEDEEDEIMVEETVIEREQDETVQFPRLKTFKLCGLSSLTTIWKRVIPLGSFQELNSLRVVCCRRLRYLFTRTMVQRLQRLENLEIERCRQMKKIIKSEEDEEDEIMVEEEEDEEDEIVLSDEEEEDEEEEDEEDEIMVEEDHQEIMIEETMVEREQDETVHFPRLKSFKLRRLPKLLGFYRPNILWPSLELLHVYDCPNLEKRPLGLQSAIKLRKLSGDNIEWFEGLEWEDQSVKSRLLPLFLSLDDLEALGWD